MQGGKRQLAEETRDFSSSLFRRSNNEIPSDSSTRELLGNVTIKDIRTGQKYVVDVDVRPTLSRIARGESYPHKKDGAIWENRPSKRTGEILLPIKPEGYYTEYVVLSDMMIHVGPQRIVTGKDGEAYYSPDHYETFIKIREETQ